MTEIRSLIQSARVVICMGPGGVGKTTCSAAIAIAAAISGKRTALLSIDPAQRLGDALGLKLSGELTQVNLSGVPQGFLHAALLDQSRVFDEMVSAYAKDPKTIELILRHPLYVAASKNFGGAVEYMALAKLSQILKSAQFDLVIVDTPPDAHAIDFLSRPNILAGFMDHQVMRWLIKPFYLAQKWGMGRILEMSERFASGIAKVTGTKALQVLAEFLVLMQDTMQGFHEAGQYLDGILHESSTKYIIITTPKSAPVRTALSVVQQLILNRFPLNMVILNRVIPEEIRAQFLNDSSEWSKPAASKNWLFFEQRRFDAEKKCEEDFSLELGKLCNKPVPLQRIVEQKNDVNSQLGIINLASDM